MKSPVTVKELKKFIKDIPDDVELFVDFYKYKPVTDIGISSVNGKITKLLIDIRVEK